MKRWYVVRTHAMAEEKANFNLTRQGYNSYLPRYLKRRSHARRVCWAPQPLFPRYLFVRMDTRTTQWRAIRSTFGVSHFICQGDEPSPAPDGVVEKIMASENDKGYVGLNRETRFRKGQAVEIADGPMAEASAIFDCVDDNDRVTLLMDLMGRRLRVRVPLEAIRATA
ncbi:MAG TPA: transcriptional activator RfaH [Rhodospirillales bacterium]|nr:transcriptional activator RfaH [Rhodospirillales bacterium]